MVRTLLCMVLMMTVVWAGAKGPQRDVTGTVTRVIDGDSLWLRPSAGGEPLQLRLEGIDAPEICQAWGTQSRQALADLVRDQTVRVRISGLDDHGRSLGTVMRGEVDVNREQVLEGHAWSYRFRSDPGPYVVQERIAIALRRGLHAAGGAMQPRDFRQINGPCTSDAAVPNPPTQRGAPPPAPVAFPPPQVQPPGAAAPVPVPAYQCDGRKYCSQMRSCEEATYFLRHCPGVRMDGDGNGVPCERQWCGR